MGEGARRADEGSWPQAQSIKYFSLLCDFILDKHLHFVLHTFRLPSKGSPLMTVIRDGDRCGACGVGLSWPELSRAVD